jgi:hypothetical protein
VHKIALRTGLAAMLAGTMAVGFSTAAAASPNDGYMIGNGHISSLRPDQVKLHPMFMKNVANQWVAAPADSPLQPPAPPCPEAGQLPSDPIGLLGNCGLGELPATGAPIVGNMAYWGGPVQVHPREYLILWGWGEKGAFAGPCKKETLREVVASGKKTATTLKCDPDGVGKRMADFVSQLGGSKWAGVQSQYYQIVNGKKTYISNDKHTLGGIWADNTNKITAKVNYTNMAQEAQRAAAHFHVAKKDLINANFIIAQPQLYSDPVAAAEGYCAFHDYTQHNMEGNIYNKVTPGLVYTNMPYLLGQGSGCGQNLINAGAAGRLDGVTIALGHEIMEAATDPGAEDILPDGTIIGGWYDPFDSDENGDKCAYVGDDQGLTDPATFPNTPGSGGNITGNRGGKFPVQSLWSNVAAGGAGYCAGGANDLPF